MTEIAMNVAMPHGVIHWNLPQKEHRLQSSVRFSIKGRCLGHDMVNVWLSVSYVEKTLYFRSKQQK